MDQEEDRGWGAQKCGGLRTDILSLSLREVGWGTRAPSHNSDGKVPLWGTSAAVVQSNVTSTKLRASQVAEY